MCHLAERLLHLLHPEDDNADAVSGHPQPARRHRPTRFRISQLRLR